jgi:hypothetical protein
MLAGLEQDEREIIRSCITAILNGNFLDDDEFQTRLGVGRQEFAQVLDSFPAANYNADDPIPVLSINNTLNEICYGIGMSENDWSKWFDVPREKVQAVYEKWARLNSWNSTGIR